MKSGTATLVIFVVLMLAIVNATTSFFGVKGGGIVAAAVS